MSWGWNSLRVLLLMLLLLDICKDGRYHICWCRVLWLWICSFILCLLLYPWSVDLLRAIIHRQRWNTSRSYCIMKIRLLLLRRVSCSGAYHAQGSLMKFSCADKLIGGTSTSNSVSNWLLQSWWNSWHRHSVCGYVRDICSKYSAHWGCSVCWISTCKHNCGIVLLWHVMMLLVGALDSCHPRSTAICRSAEWISLDNNDVWVLFVALF